MAKVQQVDKKSLVFEALDDLGVDATSGEIRAYVAKKKGGEISYKWIGRCRKKYLDNPLLNPVKASKEKQSVNRSEMIRDLLRKSNTPLTNASIIKKMGVRVSGSLIAQQRRVLEKERKVEVPNVLAEVPGAQYRELPPPVHMPTLHNVTDILAVAKFCRDNQLTTEQVRDIVDDIDLISSLSKPGTGVS